ncbi:LacI family DNA-binding transcriptional regulator [Paenibacillus agaridevorans]|uniref:LacI family DNA-binding transcriptional regulator n=1 Tax=Paenibacillus agaridevorans TaxID=171404 RepID=UPI001BE48D2E|nr:LacI family DNA-binding transcriptional regulator [Paenibacillus agaridevorans]
MRVTIKDVANKAQVSPSTVSRVIAGNGRIGKDTIQRVRQVLDELGYHPHHAAQGLAKRTTCTLGIILPRTPDDVFSNFFFPELIRGISTRASRSGFDILMATGSLAQEERESLTRMVRGGRVDGVVLLSSRLEDPLIRLLEEEQFPYVLIGRNDYSASTLSVDTDNIRAAYELTQHLIAQGNQRIGFVAGPANMIVNRDRLEGYRKAMEEARYPVQDEWIIDGELLQQSGFRAISMLMELEDRPTALVVIDDGVCFGVLRGLGELGYHVPRDISLAAFNNIALSELSTPSLTSIDIGTYQLGYTAAHQLLLLLAGEEKAKSRFIIPHRLVVRESSLRK